MKKNIIIAAAIIAGTGAAAYLLRKFIPGNKTIEDQTRKRSHHLTDAFARAKNHTSEPA